MASNQIDIFDFLKDVGPTETVHPEDDAILSKIPKSAHKFDLQCLPTPFYGPLRTAKIVLLYSNPGLTEKDKESANDFFEQQFFYKQRQGNEPLRSQIGLQKKSWWVSRTKRICEDTDYLRTRLAVLELCPYHSIEFKNVRLVKQLPSYKVALNWAHKELFPRARARQVVVICLRAAKHWGLQENVGDGYLFVPKVNRSGHMLKEGRDVVINAARQILDLRSAG
ncbi:MAG: hypothetical protein J0G37_18150 [Afipia sp.]|nr:hypothetical protein [Afipia sp.]